MTQAPTPYPTLYINRPDHNGLQDDDKSENMEVVLGLAAGSIVFTCIFGMLYCYFSEKPGTDVSLNEHFV